MNYIDNNGLQEKFLRYKKLMDEAEERGETRKSVDVPEEIILDVWTIATNNARNFRNVSEDVREDGIQLGVEYCIRYLHNYNPDKFKNPFAYVTQICKNGMLATINKESAETRKKLRYLSYQACGSTIRSDGEIDPIINGDFANEYVRNSEQQQKDYESDQY